MNFKFILSMSPVVLCTLSDCFALDFCVSTCVIIFKPMLSVSPVVHFDFFKLLFLAVVHLLTLTKCHVYFRLF